MARTLDEDELVGNWTLVGDELALLSNRRAPTKLAFALMLRFYALHGRFPRGRHELPDQAVGYLARLVKVGEDELALYERDGRTSKEHRKEIRDYFGFRECGVADADKAALWLAANVCDKERQADRVRVALLAHLREEKLEQPAPDRIRRITGSAISQAEKAQTAFIAGRVPQEAVARISALIAHSADPGAEEDGGGQDAAALGAGTPSQYRYLTGKDDLLDLMADAVMRARTPPAPSGDWHADLRALAGEARAAALAHPWLPAVTAARPGLGPGALRWTEAWLTALDGLGLSPDAMLTAVTTVRFFVDGAVASELAQRGLDMDAWVSAQGAYGDAIISGGQYPRLARVMVEAEGPARPRPRRTRLPRRPRTRPGRHRPPYPPDVEQEMILLGVESGDDETL